MPTCTHKLVPLVSAADHPRTESGILCSAGLIHSFKCMCGMSVCERKEASHGGVHSIWGTMFLSFSVTKRVERGTFPPLEEMSQAQDTDDGADRARGYTRDNTAVNIITRSSQKGVWVTHFHGLPEAWTLF
jgi:hypothetical protein